MTQPYPRSQWAVLLAAAPADAVCRLAAGYASADLQVPQAGLALLQLQDSALGEAYFLGELPLARARVRVLDASGAASEGAAQLLDDRVVLARAIAVLDAVLAGPLQGASEAQALLVQGAALLEAQRRERRAMLAATRVDFSLIGTDMEDDDA